MMSMAASFSTVSSSSLPRHRSHILSPQPPLFSTSPLKKGVWGQRFLMLKVSCELEGSKATVQSEPEMTSSSSAILGSSSSYALNDEDDRSISAYKWCAVLAGIGFVDTSYLTYLKLTDSNALCPTGEGSCNTILTSDFFSVFGVRLPLCGMLAYGLVAILGLQLQLSHKKMAFDVQKTTALTFSLFFISLKNFGLGQIQSKLGSQLCIASLVIALSTSYNAVQLLPSSLAATELPYVETEITGESSQLALSLARHLHSIGAKLYGAFWCSHCVHQKQMFGREAAKLLDYVECYPDGLKAGTKMAEACYDIKLEAFPSWLINGQVLSGEKQFPELARLSGIKLEDLSQKNLSIN